MAYGFDQIFAADPANPANIAQNASVTIFAPGDPTMTPIAVTDTSGTPLPNPMPVNANGFGPAFRAEIDRVAWLGGGFTGFFTSYEGLKEEAVAARAAAETAAASAAGAVSEAATAALAAQEAATTNAPVRQIDASGTSTPATFAIRLDANGDIDALVLNGVDL
jgi:hypothetical protein